MKYYMSEGINPAPGDDDPKPDLEEILEDTEDDEDEDEEDEEDEEEDDDPLA